MPLPRFQIRTLMVVVVVVAILVWAGIEGPRLYRLSRRYEARSLGLAKIEAEVRGNLADVEKSLPEVIVTMGKIEEEMKTAPNNDDLKKLLRLYKRMERDTRDNIKFWTEEAELCANMKRKYQRAARYPWLPVEPDPLKRPSGDIENEELSGPP